MYKHLTQQEFIQIVQMSKPQEFTQDGLKALYNSLLECEKDTCISCAGELELDIEELCVNFCEDTLENALDKFCVPCYSALINQTRVIPVGNTGRVVYNNF